MGRLGSDFFFRVILLHFGAPLRSTWIISCQGLIEHLNEGRTLYLIEDPFDSLKKRQAAHKVCTRGCHEGNAIPSHRSRRRAALTIPTRNLHRLLHQLVLPTPSRLVTSFPLFSNVIDVEARTLDSYVIARRGLL